MDNEVRLIDANAFIEANKDIIDCSIDHSKYEDTLRELIDNAPTVDTYTEGEWIPISVQEPDVGGIYLVTAKHVISGHIGTDIARRLSDDVWTFGCEELKGTEIIAWQPLPKPFKEEENDI